MWKMANSLPKNDHLLTMMGSAIFKAACLNDLIDWYYAYEHVVPLDIQLQGAPSAVDWLLHETTDIKNLIAVSDKITKQLEELGL